MKRECKHRWVLGILMMGVLLFSFNHTQAQRYRESEGTWERVGIKGGLNTSNLMKKGEVTDRDPRLGFHVGLFGNIFATQYFAIQPEVNFSTKGNQVKTRSGVIDHQTRINLSYIDIPVLMVFKLGRAAEIHAGAYWAYLVGASLDIDGDIRVDFRDLDRRNFESWDYGLVGGLGFNLGPVVQVGARYNYGLKDVADSPGARRMLGNARNSVGQLYLAINFAATENQRAARREGRAEY